MRATPLGDEDAGDADAPMVDTQIDNLEKIIDINIATEVKSRKLVPHHVIQATDLFCNRELNMGYIEAIGFDMDWTLAQYNQDFDLLAFNGAKENLVKFGYPKDVLDFTYNQTMYRRCCKVDKVRGNIIKQDRYGYVRVAEHGRTPLSREMRKATYTRDHKQIKAMMGDNFPTTDTPFGIVDVALFGQLVELKDKMERANEFLAKKSYPDLWTDLRDAVNFCHKTDEVIKTSVAQDPQKYIDYEPKIMQMLKKFRKAGKKVFLLTNSDFLYTQVVMNYLEGKKKGDECDFAWMDYFDLIIVDGQKPSFLEKDDMPLYRYNFLKNTISAIDYRSEDPKDIMAAGKVFQNGNAKVLQRLLDVSGDKILYVGDHIYADVLRTKRTLMWRTCLIVPELQEEMRTDRRVRLQKAQLESRRGEQAELEEDLDVLQQRHWELTEIENEGNEMQIEGRDQLLRRLCDMHFYSSKRLSMLLSRSYYDIVIVSTVILTITILTIVIMFIIISYRTDLAVKLQNLESEIAVKSSALLVLKEEIRGRQEELNREYHPRWGPLYKGHRQKSSFGNQIMDFSCVYTSHPKNLGLVSPTGTIPPVRDKMPHDAIIEDSF
jgi:HAD superfamily 5'-nucleotidase-like hydrolase